MFEKCDSLNSKNEWFPFSANFTTKFGFVFVLRGFILKPTEKA